MPLHDQPDGHARRDARAHQETAIRELADRHGWGVRFYPPETDVSYNKPLAERPALGPAVLDIIEGRADVLLADAEDRLWWNHGTAAEVRRLVHGAGGEVWTAAEGRIGEDDPTDELSRTVRTAANRFSQLMNAKKSRRAVIAAIDEGKWPTPAASIGYRFDSSHRLVVDKDAAQLVRRAFVMRTEGATVREIRAFLAEHGVGRAMQAIVRLLSNRAYLGEIVFGTLRNPAAHEPIVNRELFDRAQRSKGTAGRRAKSDRLLARADVLHCGTCSARMSLSTDGRGHPFYRCGNVDCDRRSTVAAHAAETVILEHARELLRSSRGRARADAEHELRDAVAERECLDDELAALVRAFAAAGLADDATAVAELGAKRELRDQARDRADRLVDHSGRVELPAIDVFDLGTVAEQRDVIRRLGIRATVRPGKGPDRVRVEPVVE